MSRTLRILVVEDNSADADFIRELLPRQGSAGFQIESVARLAEAITRLERKDIDLVLLDLGLPDSQGLATFRKLRQAVADVPVIVLSGASDEELAVTAVQEGAQDYLVKGMVGGSLLTRAVLQALVRHKLDSQLRASERDFRNLAEAMPQIVWATRPDGWTIYFNQHWVAYTGLTLAESYGINWIKPFHPDDQLRVQAAWQNAVENGGEYSQECRLRRADGTYRWWLVRGVPQRDENGNIHKWFGTCTDIDDIKQAEVEQRRLNRELSVISNCNLALLHAEDELTLLQNVCRILCDKAGYRMAWVGYGEHDAAKIIRPIAWAGVEDGYLESAAISWADTERGRGPTGIAMRCDTIEYVQDYATDPHVALWREAALQRGYRSSIGLPLKGEDGAIFGVFTVYANEPNAFTPVEIRLLKELAGDLTFGINVIRSRAERKLAEKFRALSLEIMEQLTQPGTLREIIQGVIATLKAKTGFDAVGIRLEAGEDYPYFEQQGFSKDFLLTENTLVARAGDGGICRNKDGKVCLECTCGVVISGQADPASKFFTPGGSFWTSDSLPMLDIPAGQDPRLHPRNVCIHHGYASVALIPLRHDQKIIGLLQLNDRRKNCFNLAAVELLEGIAAHIGSAMIRKEVEDSLARLAMAVEQAAETIVITDTRGAILYANPAFEITTGYTCAEALGQNPRVLKSGKHEAAYYRQMWETILGGKSWTGHFINKRKDGTLYEEEATISPIRDTAGKIINYVAVKRDVTHEVEMEDQLRQSQKMEAIGTLAGGIAHDFNNILNVIFGYSNLLQLDLVGNPESLDKVGEILKAGGRAKDLVQQILTFSRKGKQERQVIHINGVIKEVTKLLRSSLPANIEIQTDLAADAPAVLADATQIYQVVMNLGANALHAMEKQATGRMTVTLDAFLPDKAFIKKNPELRAIKYARLTVADTGCGMDAKTLARIYDPFYTTKAIGKGTGLGMAVVHGIVEAHDGVITVESQPGLGTSFRLYFPEQVQDMFLEGIPEDLIPCGQGQRILMVDDEAVLKGMYQKLFKALKYEGTVVTSPDEAIRLVRENPTQFDLVITDLTMPEMNGLEVARQIREIREDLPIILATGYQGTVTKPQLDGAGICELVEKPISMATLAKVLRGILGKK